MTLLDLIYKELNEVYWVNGQAVKGQSVSFLHKEIRSRVKGLGNLATFETMLENNGLTVQDGVNYRNRSTRVVYREVK